MAAPKLWGYTREKPITDELLVSWADGDLTADLVREVEDRLLAHPEERRRVAAYARAMADTLAPEGQEDRILWPPRGLVEACKGAGAEEPRSPASAGGSARRPASLRRWGGAGIVVLALLLAVWIVRNLS